MAQADWDKAIAEWRCSKGADPNVIPDEERQALERLMKWFADNCWETIDLWGAITPETLEKDGLARTDALQLASEQLARHKIAHRSHLDQKKSKVAAYEMPFVLRESVLRYLKVQFRNDNHQLHDPTKIDKLGLRYHEPKKVGEAI